MHSQINQYKVNNLNSNNNSNSLNSNPNNYSLMHLQQQLQQHQHHQNTLQHSNNNNQNSFVSPLRAGGVATTAAVPTNNFNHRGMSSSPYTNNKKQRNEKSHQRLGVGLGMSSGGFGAGISNPMISLGLSSNTADNFSEEDINRMVSYNQLNLDTQERKYYELLESEKMQLKRKDQASREIIQEISRKLKLTEKKATEESKTSLEFKKKHDQMRRKLEKAQKEKLENVNQLKSLFVLFTQQRKALELSIQKSKKLEDDNQLLATRNKNLEDQHKMFYQRIEQLEQDQGMLIQKHKRDKDQLEGDVEEKRKLLKQYELEFKEVQQHKQMMKRQLDEYETKIKKLIIEFEEESKKHIRELNEVHEQYRGYKTSSMELEQKVQQLKMEQQRSVHGEREARKEIMRLKIENEQFRQRIVMGDYSQQQQQQQLQHQQHQLDEYNQHQLEEEEDDEAQVMPQRGRKQESHKQLSAVQQMHNQNDPQLQNMRSQLNNQYAQQLLGQNYMQNNNEQEGYDDDEEAAAMYGNEFEEEEDGGYGQVVDIDHIDPDLLSQAQIFQHQLQLQLLNDQMQESQMNQQPLNDVISGEQTIEQSDNHRGVNGSGKNKRETNIEVLDDENSIQKYQQKQQHQQQQKMQQRFDDEEEEEQILHGRHVEDDEEESGRDEQDGQSESEDLLKKLIENIGGNPALQNVYIKEQFKLDQIKSENDLHDYKNLLNSMAALFYTNHRLSDVTVMFYMWREAALQKQKEQALQIQENQLQCQQVEAQQFQKLNQSSSKKVGGSRQKSPGNNRVGKPVPPGGIQIDTELANKEMYRNYHQQNDHYEQEGLRHDTDEDLPSEIQKDQKLMQNMMIHIEGDEDDRNNPLREEEQHHPLHDYDDSIHIHVDDTDERRDSMCKKVLDDLKQIGPYSKQILNYTYPPLLYQRGDEDDEDDENQGINDLRDGLPDLVQEYGEDEDQDIEELIKGGGGMINNDLLYAKLQNVVQDKEARKYVEKVDDNGNIYLVEAEQYSDDDYDEDGLDDGRPAVMMQPDQEALQYMDDEEFLEMMEHEANRRRIGADQNDLLQQQNSTIINSSQNTSLEDKFIAQ